MKFLALVDIKLTDRVVFNEEVGTQTLTEGVYDAMEALEIPGCEVVLLEMMPTRQNSLPTRKKR